jgi:hypothetical protein
MFTGKECSVPFHREIDRKETTKSDTISMLMTLFFSSMDKERKSQQCS